MPPRVTANLQRRLGNPDKGCCPDWISRRYSTRRVYWHLAVDHNLFIFNKLQVLIIFKKEKLFHPVGSPPPGRVIHLEHIEVINRAVDAVAGEQLLRGESMRHGYRVIFVEAENIEGLLPVYRNMITHPYRRLCHFLCFFLTGKYYHATTVRL